MANSLLKEAITQYGGVLRLAPTWVPRSFCRPGKRLKLHPDDYYCYGLERGGIDERWLSSTTHADNGPGTPDDEGLSYIVLNANGERITMLEAVDSLKGMIIGEALYEKYSRWPIYSKFFDNMGPLPHHVHYDDIHAGRVGQNGKPEMYFFPSQMNNHGGEFPFTFFGFNPGITKDQVRRCLTDFLAGDNKILDLSRCYKLTVDTGWDVPPGILHAPGSLCTYEPQVASDVYAMYQSVLYGGQCVPEALQWKDCPKQERGNFDYLMDVIDWQANTDPYFYQHRFMMPVDVAGNAGKGYQEQWICYRSKAVCAKRLIVPPASDVTVCDGAAYGLIVLQGHGSINSCPLETPSLIRFGQLTFDEYFVIEKAARQGVRFCNNSHTEPMVLLKHFADNPDLPENL